MAGLCSAAGGTAADRTDHTQSVEFVENHLHSRFGSRSVAAGNIDCLENLWSEAAAEGDFRTSRQRAVADSLG